MPSIKTVSEGDNIESSASCHSAVWEPLWDDPAVRRMGFAQRNQPQPERTPPWRLAEDPRLESVSGEIAATVKHYVRSMTDSFVRFATSADIARAVWEKLESRYPSPLTPIEHWIHGLVSPTRQADTPALEWIKDDVEKWRGDTVIVRSREAVRVWFRLIEPAQGDSGPLWYLHFGLGAADDPAIERHAAQIWACTDDVTDMDGVTVYSPQESLLTGLSQAAERFLPLQRILSEPAPTALAMTTEEAYEFLKSHAAQLQSLGFSVSVPHWWRRRPRWSLRLQLLPYEADHLGAGGSPSGQLGLHSLARFDWQLAVGDNSLSLEQWEAMAESKLPFVSIRGQWVEFDRHQVERMIHHGHALQSRSIRLGDALKLALQEDAGFGWSEEWDGSARIPIHLSDEGEMGSWVRRWQSAADSIRSLPQPPLLQGQLRPYQQSGFSWLVSMRRLGLGACLADDMGLGKTVQWIAHWIELTGSGELKGPALIVCPTSVLDNWQRELDRFAPHFRVLLHYGPDRARGESFAADAAQFDVVLTTYATAQRDSETLGLIRWDNITLDEAQQIKNRLTKQSRTIRQLPSKHRIALTGTPIENRLDELWSIMDFLNPGYLGSAEQFRSSFGRAIETEHQPEASVALQRILRPFLLRREKSDRRIIQDLPDKIETKEYCLLTHEQAALYEGCVLNLMDRLKQAQGIERRGLILSSITQLKQICNHPVHYSRGTRIEEGRSGKLVRLAELTEQIIHAGEKALIFTQYAAMAKLLQSYLERKFNKEVFLLHGGVPKRERDRMIQRFQYEPDGPQLFVLSLKAGGFGLNLTQASHVIHYDRWWNPAVENQATDRAYRIGQRNRVHVHKLICSGTLEEQIDRLIEAKEGLSDRVVGSEGDGLTELTNEELQEMLALRRKYLSDADDEIG